MGRYLLRKYSGCLKVTPFVLLALSFYQNPSRPVTMYCQLHCTGGDVECYQHREYIMLFFSADQVDGQALIRRKKIRFFGARRRECVGDKQRCGCLVLCLSMMSVTSS